MREVYFVYTRLVIVSGIALQFDSLVTVKTLIQEQLEYQYRMEWYPGRVCQE